jgi:opacity protein-like surface antigen
MNRHMSKLVAATAALVLTAGAAAAQRPQLSIGGGTSLPTGDLGTSQAAGWHGQVSMGYRPAMSPVGFRIDGMYHDLAAEATSGANFRTVAVSGNAVIEAPGMAVRPYLIGGAGLYNTKFQGVQSRNNLGLNGGVGLKFRMLDLETFVEARYHTALDAAGPSTDQRAANFVPITFGISF